MSLNSPGARAANPTAQGGYFRGLAEAFWLAAVIGTPILVDPQAFAGFQPFKSLFLVFCSLGLLTAWAIRGVQSLGAPRREGWGGRSGIGLTLAALCASVGISLLISVYPAQSLWGSYELRQGGLTLLCYLVFFVAMAVIRTTEQQRRRLVTAIIVSSIPLSLHAILQRAGCDPLPFNVVGGGRVVGLAGNPIFLSATLGCVVPLTLWRAHEPLSGGGGRRRPLGEAWFYGGVVILQVLAFVLAESRGPFIGLVASISYLGLVRFATLSRKNLIRILLAVGAVACVLGFLFLNRQASGSVSGIPVLNRLAGSAPGGEMADEARPALWKQAAKIVISPDPFRYPSGETDRWHALRPFFGYGPETLQCVLPQWFSFPNAGARVESRFHNWAWDAWFNCGFFGLLAYMALVSQVFGLGYRRLGLLQGRTEALIYAASVVLGIITLCCAMVALFGIGFLGIGISCGLVIGVTAYPVVRGLLAPRPATREPPGAAGPPLVVPLMAVLVFHLVETSFAFPVAPTALLFWISLGMIVGLSRGAGDDPVPFESAEGAGGHGVGRSAMRAAVALAMPVALVLVVLGFSFLYLNSLKPSSVLHVLYGSLLRIRGEGGPSHLLPVVVVPTLVAAAFAFCSDLRPANRGTGMRTAILATVLVATVIGTGYAFCKAWQIAEAGPFSPDPQAVQRAVGLGRDYSFIAVSFFAACLVCVLALGWSLSGDAARQKRTPSVGRLGAAGAILAIACIAAWRFCLVPVCADTHEGCATVLKAAGDSRGAIEEFGKALALDPRVVAYRFALADILKLPAGGPGGEPSTLEGFVAAEKVLLEGMRYSMLDRGSLFLGELDLRWAAELETPDARRARARMARDSLERALVFEGYSEPAFVDVAVADAVFLDDESGAANAMARANGLVSDADAESWTYYFSQSAEATPEPDLRGLFARRALWCSDRAIAYAALRRQPAFGLHLHAGELRSMLGENDRALAQYRLAVDEDHNPDEWRAEALLAQCYLGSGDISSAFTYADRALESAPASAKASVAELRDRIGRAH
jgi:tetratricopeptide (TPR) repeat protein